MRSRLFARLWQWRQKPKQSAKEAPDPLLSVPGVWVGETLQAAALPVRPGERTPGADSKTHLHPGQDLVSEQAVQMQASEAGHVTGAGGVPTSTEEDSGTGAGAGREAVWRRSLSFHSLQRNPGTPSVWQRKQRPVWLRVSQRVWFNWVRGAFPPVSGSFTEL